MYNVQYCPWDKTTLKCSWIEAPVIYLPYTSGIINESIEIIHYHYCQKKKKSHL